MLSTLTVDPLTLDLIFTAWAVACLLGLWMAAAVVLPWEPEDFEELDEELARLRQAAAPQPALAHNK